MKHKRYRLLAAALLLAALLCHSAWGAENRTPIDHMILQVDSTIQSGSSGGNVHVSTSDSHYRVGDVEILNDNDDWMGGMIPRVSISLYADSGYYFNSTGKNAFDFSGEDVTYVTSKREDDKSTLIVTIKLSKLDNGDLSISGLTWDESNGVAMWDENPSARSYQVRLYRDGSSVTSSRSVSEEQYDFAGDITRRGDYSFEVRAIGSGSDKGDWESSDTWYVTSAEADDLSYRYDHYGSYTSSSGGPGASGSNDQTSSGSGGPGATGSSGGVWCLDQYGWWYRNADGSYTRNNWQVIDNLYYFFNESGYMRVGWIPWNQKWYYCGPDGALWSNRKTPDGLYVGGDGVWIP